MWMSPMHLMPLYPSELEPKKANFGCQQCTLSLIPPYLRNRTTESKLQPLQPLFNTPCIILGQVRVIVIVVVINAVMHLVPRNKSKENNLQPLQPLSTKPYIVVKQVGVVVVVVVINAPYPLKMEPKKVNYNHQPLEQWLCINAPFSSTNL